MGKPDWYYPLKNVKNKVKSDEICDEYSEDGFCTAGEFCDRKHIEGETQLSKEVILQYTYRSFAPHLIVRKWNPTAKNEDFFNSPKFICAQIPNKSEQISKLWKYLRKSKKKSNVVVPTVKNASENWNLGISHPNIKSNYQFETETLPMPSSTLSN